MTQKKELKAEWRKKPILDIGKKIELIVWALRV